MKASKLNNISTKIGLKIVILRRKLGLSQEELAQKANISTVALSAIERGTSSARIDTLERIANALNIKLTKLIDVSKVDLN